MINLKLTKPIVFIDVETTGLNRTKKDRIIQVSAIKVHPNGKEETLSSFINPEMSIPKDSIKIHGIKDIDVIGKPTFWEFAGELIDFIKDCDLGGFGMKFDLTILEQEFKRVGKDYSSEGRKIVDVQRIYHELEPRDLSAAYLKYCGKHLEDAHEANADSRAAIDVLQCQLEKHSNLPKDVNGLHEFCNPKDPSLLDSDGKFVWDEGKVVINFGPHAGKTLDFISENEKGFLQWMLTRDFSQEVKGIVKNALEGRFPKQEKFS